MSDLIVYEPTPAPELPDDWTFEKADKDFDKFITSGRKALYLGIGKAFEIYLFYAKREHDEKGRFTSVANATVATWEKWCESKGIHRTTLYRHFLKLGWTTKEEKETPNLPSDKYRIIYADPPWQYGNAQHGKEEQETVLETHYPTMPDEKIMALPIQELAAPCSVLFLWATSPLLFLAKTVADAWCFEYKAQFIWDKVKHNVGYYNSVRHEHLLICTKGSCLPDSKELHDSVVSIERNGHSEKPAYFRELIDKMYPQGKRIELFARGTLPKGWDRWGNE